MIRFIRTALLFLALGLAASAQAQLFRAYLSGSGSDTNPCTLVAPCRLLPAALNAVASGGEIWMLDSANYNSSTVNINKSVSILAIPGVVGSIVAISGGHAITINGAGAKVALRDLVITSNATAPGQSGIVVSAATSVSVDRTLFSGLPLNGIDVETSATLHVGDSLLRNIGSSGQDSAIVVGGGASAEIVDTKIDTSAGFGVQVIGSTTGVTSRASVVNSSITHAGNCGLFSYTSNAAALTVLDAVRTSLSNSNAGLCVQGGVNAVASINGAAIQQNTYGVYILTSGAVVKSFGNNSITSNANNFPGGAMTGAALQ